MILYLSIILVYVVILSAINVLCSFTPISPSYTILIIFIAPIIEIVIDGLVALLVHQLPNKWFEIDNKFYKVSDKERKFYEKIKIRKWKDKVVELGALGGFSKKELKSSNDIEYIKKFLIESNKGVLNHILSCFAGFLLILIYLPFDCIFSISLPIAIMNLILNMPSTFILRYNTPKLLAGYKRLLRTNKQNKNTEKHSNTNIELSTFNTNVTPEIQLENSNSSSELKNQIDS